MSLAEQRVVIDTDFFLNTTQYEAGTGLFEKLMKVNGYIPVMHKYAAKVELRDNLKLKDLLDRDKVECIGESQYLKQGDEDYNEYFRNAYERINHYELGNVDIWKYGYDGQHPKESLGEIRSVYMAAVKGYKIILSEDGDTKVLARFMSSKRAAVSVETLYQLLIKKTAETTSLLWSDIKVTAQKVFLPNRKERYQTIYDLYSASKGIKQC